jgi:diguanylate cyclase (GGDEF)-like protein
VGQLAIGLQNARDYREQLEQAIRDPLTGIYNRRFFYEALEKEVQRQGRYGSPVSFVLFDLDDFKRVNDRHGHAAGDDALCRFAELAMDLIRPVDSFARLGGEEFGLLLPETMRLDALMVAERIRSAAAREHILPGCNLQVSAGISNCPEDASTAKALEKRADEALYWAKHNGKNISALASEVTLAEESGEQYAVAPLYALVEMIDSHLRTRDHSDNVALYATALGRSLGLEPDSLVKLQRAAQLHDIGKVAVSAEILCKPGKLNRNEFAEVWRHPLVGSMMLAHAGLGVESRWVRHHHERMDGGGYPDGLRGEEIPRESRIIFVADSFEAMTSDRPYSSGMRVEQAVEELRACAGSQFDARVVESLVQLVERGELAVSPLRHEVTSH